jgi:hypothetical protein
MNSPMERSNASALDANIKAGIAESYTGNMSWFRGTKAIIKAQVPERKLIFVDGEPMDRAYNDFGCADLLPGEIEMLFNPN